MESIESQSEQNIARWRAIAESWDDSIGDDGNDFYAEVVLPAIVELVDLRAGEQVLDLASGNGVVARKLALAGAGSVIATDGCPALLDKAIFRGEQAEIRNIGYDSLDVTKVNELDELIQSYEWLVISRQPLVVPAK
ncbi:MAG: hypothetical protein Q9160_007098 [Pyrenula sp. 1 TL-2023]